MRVESYRRRFATTLQLTVFCCTAVLMAAPCRAESPRQRGRRDSDSRISSTTPDLRDATRTKDETAKLTLELAEKFPGLLSRKAELEASYVEFLADFHFGVDQWFNHRVEAGVTNVDTIWYGGLRQWEIYSFSPGGIQLVGQGQVPVLAPGETYQIKISLPSTVSFQATYALLLSSGDPNRDNDLAVYEP